MMLSITEMVQKVRKSIFRPHEILTMGGEWLGAARSWIQWSCINGSDVTWGSDDRLMFSKQLTVKDIEEFAARIAVATLEEYKQQLVTEGEVAALKAYQNKDNWSSYIKDDRQGNLVAFCPDREKLHFLMSYSHKHGWDLAECIDKKADVAGGDSNGNT